MIRAITCYCLYNLRSLRGAFRARTGLASGIAVGVVVAIVAIGQGGNEIARVLQRYDVDVTVALSSLVLVTCFIGLILGLFTVVVALFEPRQVEELERFRVLPIHPAALFACKTIDQLPSVLLTLYLVFPVLQLVCDQAGLGTGGLLLIAAALALVLVQVLFVLVAGIVLAVQLLPAQLVRMRVMLVGTLLLLLAAAVAMMFASDERLRTLWSSSGGLLPQATWISEMMTGLQAGESRTVLRGLSSVVAATLLTGAVAEWTYTRVFLGRFELLLSKLRRTGMLATTGISARVGRAIGGPSVTGVGATDRGGQITALLRKEWLQLRRDRTFMLIGVMLTVVLLLPIGMIIGSPQDRRGPALIVYWAVLGLVGQNLIGFLALSSVGREGAGLGVLSWLPLPTRRSLASRILFYSALSTIVAAVWAGVMGVLLPAPATVSDGRWLALLGSLALVTSVGMTWIAVMLGSIFARSTVRNPYRSVSLLGVVVFLSLEILLVFTGLGVLAAAVFVPRAVWAATTFTLLLWGAVGAFLLREGERGYRWRREGRET